MGAAFSNNWLEAAACWWFGAGFGVVSAHSNGSFASIVTVDETWIHYHTPKSNRQSAEWLQAGESRPKHPKTQCSAGKVMVSIFWDAHNIIFIEYLEKRKTIVGKYYVTLLDKLDKEIEKKWPHLDRKEILFYQDNAPAHSSIKAWWNWILCITNCFLIHLILQICPPAISICFLVWEDGFKERDFTPMRSSYRKRTPIIQSLTNRINPRLSNCWKKCIFPQWD